MHFMAEQRPFKRDAQCEGLAVQGGFYLEYSRPIEGGANLTAKDNFEHPSSGGAMPYGGARFGTSVHRQRHGHNDGISLRRLVAGLSKPHPRHHQGPT